MPEPEPLGEAHPECVASGHRLPYKITMRPTFKLSRLREMGSNTRDPIGLNGVEDRPDDEYGSYLLQAAGRLWNGAGEDEVADYLVYASRPNTWALGPGTMFASEPRARWCVP